MKSGTYEGAYPCMHNHLINHSERIIGFKEKKFLVCSFEFWSEGKKRKAEIEMKNQLYYLTAVEVDRTFNDVFNGEHHDSCVN